MHANLKTLRARYPRHFTTLPEHVLAWHRVEAENSERSHRWSTAAWRLSELLKSTPEQASSCGVAASRAELKQWALAKEDFSKLIALGETHSETFIRWLLVSSKASDRAKCREICAWLIERAQARAVLFSLNGQAFGD